MVQHRVYSAAARAPVQRGFQFRYRFSSPCRDNLHMSFIRVFHPSAQTKFRRLAMNEPAKSNALHSPFYKKMPHFKRVIHLPSLALPGVPRNVLSGTGSG